MEKNKEENKNNIKNSITSTTGISEIKNIQYIFGKENKKIYIGIITYLQYRDIIFLQSANKYFYSILHSKITLKIYALKGLINSSENRLLFYNSCINMKKLFNNLKKELIDYKIETNIYNNILK